MKSLVKTVATTAVVLSALAGCASRSSGGSSSTAPGAGNGTTSASSSSSASQPSSSPSTTGQTGASTPASPGTVKYVSPQGVALSKDGITLVTEVSWGGCNEQPKLVVTSQDAKKVVVELKTVSHYRVGIMCPDFARNGEATVKLAAPLGSREVVDGVKNVPLIVH